MSTYQSVSGHSGAGIDILNDEIKQYLLNEPLGDNHSVFPRPVLFKCIPHIDSFTASGYTREELKMVNETRKIFGEPNLLFCSTTIRVPVMVGHSESVNTEFMEPMRAEKAIEILSNPMLLSGVVLVDGLKANEYTTSPSIDAYERNYTVTSDIKKDEWKDLVLVGRVRDDMTAPNTINLWCVSDNLRKGAATNAVQISEGLIDRGLL